MVSVQHTVLLDESYCPKPYALASNVRSSLTAISHQLE